MGISVSSRYILPHVRNDYVGDIVAVSIVQFNQDESGCLEMLSILPEYMGLGLTSALIRQGEYRLHLHGKSLMKMRVFLPRDCDRASLESIHYKILSIDPWDEMKGVLKQDAYESWAMITLGKHL